MFKCFFQTILQIVFNFPLVFEKLLCKEEPIMVSKILCYRRTNILIFYIRIHICNILVNSLARLYSLFIRFSFLDPIDSLQQTESTRPMSTNRKRRSQEKRPNDPFYYCARVSDPNYFIEQIGDDFTGGHTQANQDTPSHPDPEVNTNNVDLEDNCIDEGEQNDAIIPERRDEDNFGYYGRQSASVEKFLNSRTRKDPSLAIPIASEHDCTGRYFYWYLKVKTCK